MKTKFTFAVSLIVVSLLPVNSSAQGREKVYQITEEGGYQFIFARDYLGDNPIGHPITPRTFYLETKRLKLIPETVSFISFLQYPGEYIQDMLETSQSDLIAVMKSSWVDEAQQSEGKALWSSYQENSEQINQNGDQSGYMNDYKNIPWLAMAITNPGTEIIPEFIKKDAPKDSVYSQVRTKIPWIVQLMLMNGELPYSDSYDAEDISPLSATEAAKRVRLHDLVQNLLMNQDESIRSEYGRVFPGMDGKLYGLSDAELDELVQALLNMKDDFLTSSKPELRQIFNELEVLAFGQ